MRASLKRKVRCSTRCLSHKSRWLRASVILFGAAVVALGVVLVICFGEYLNPDLRVLARRPVGLERFHVNWGGGGNCGDELGNATSLLSVQSYWDEDCAYWLRVGVGIALVELHFASQRHLFPSMLSISNIIESIDKPVKLSIMTLMAKQQK